jgi:hypothetical protein
VIKSLLVCGRWPGSWMSLAKWSETRHLGDIWESSGAHASSFQNVLACRSKWVSEDDAISGGQLESPRFLVWCWDGFPVWQYQHCDLCVSSTWIWRHQSEKQGWVWRLYKSLYGTKQAPRM